VLRPCRHVLQREGRRAQTHHTVTSCLYFITIAKLAGGKVERSAVHIALCLSLVLYELQQQAGCRICSNSGQCLRYSRQSRSQFTKELRKTGGEKAFEAAARVARWWRQHRYRRAEGPRLVCPSQNLAGSRKASAPDGMQAF